jgi:hypothetical protein
MASLLSDALRWIPVSVCPVCRGGREGGVLTSRCAEPGDFGIGKEDSRLGEAVIPIPLLTSWLMSDVGRVNRTPPEWTVGNLGQVPNGGWRPTRDNWDC